MGPQAGREVRPMRDLTVRATSCLEWFDSELLQEFSQQN